MGAVVAARLLPERGREATDIFSFLDFFLFLLVSGEGLELLSSSEASWQAGDFFGDQRGCVAELGSVSLGKPTEAAGGCLMVRGTEGVGGGKA
jgi:hypothetical protein